MSYRNILATPGVAPVLFTLFMTAFGFGVILPILPFYALSLGAQPAELGMLTAAFAFTSLIFSPVMGNLSDKVGRRKVLLAGTAAFAAGYVLFGITDSLAMAFVARALEGIAAAAVFPAAMSLISDFTTEQQRGKAMGMTGMAFSFGFIIGPAFGGIASAISVKDVFWLSALLAAANFASVYFQLREPKEKAESRGITNQEVSLLQHLSSPLLFLFIGTFMITFIIGGFDAILAIFTSDRLGFSSPQIGLLFTYVGVLILVMQFVSGELINRFGEFWMILAGMVLSGSGFFLFIFTHDWLTILAPITILVAGNALVFPSVTSLVTKKVTGKRGAVLGLVSSFNSLGEVVGPLLGGFLYGYSHIYPFIAMAIVVWAYSVVFALFGRKKLEGAPVPA